MINLICSKCGASIQRERFHDAPTCFECKKKRRTVQAHNQYLLRGKRQRKEKRKYIRDVVQLKKARSTAEERQIERLGGVREGNTIKYPPIYYP